MNLCRVRRPEVDAQDANLVFGGKGARGIGKDEGKVRHCIPSSCRIKAAMDRRVLGRIGWRSETLPAGPGASSGYKLRLCLLGSRSIPAGVWSFVRLSSIDNKRDDRENVTGAAAKTGYPLSANDVHE
jgi:hypothetical protein